MPEKNKGRDAEVVQLDTFRRKKEQTISAPDTKAPETPAEPKLKDITDTLPADTTEIMPLFMASFKLMKLPKAEGVVSPKVYGEWRVTLQRETAKQIADRADKVTEDVSKKNPAYVSALYDEILRRVTTHDNQPK